MCNHTGCRAACGGEDRHSPVRWGWRDSRAERQGEAGSRILRLHTQMDLWVGGMALGRYCNGGGGVPAGYRCSPVG